MAVPNPNTFTGKVRIHRRGADRWKTHRAAGADPAALADAFWR